MDWKVKRRRMLGNESSIELSQSSQNQKGSKTKSNSHRGNHHPKTLWLSLTVLVLCHFLTPSHCFFFPKSLFRRLSSSPVSNGPPPPQISPAQESLIGSEQQIQPAFRIANRPNSYQSSSQQPNPNFHVPKALCIACERFPWMPVSGPEKPALGEQAQPSQQQSQQTQPGSPQGQNVKTIVIKALGEAKGPVPIPPQHANRKPFAIQFDSSKSTNDISTQQRPSSGDSQGEENKNADPATRPISFQIYDPPRQPTVLKPVGNLQYSNQQQQQQQGQRFPHEPSAYMQPPPNFQFQVQQMNQQSNVFFPDRIPSMSFGRPTILKPVNNNAYLPPRGNNGYGQSQGNNYNTLPQGNNNYISPPQGNNIQSPPQEPQKQQQQQQNNGNHPPIPPITVSTIVAAQHGRGPTQGKVPEFQSVQPAKLVYQEHTQVHGPSIAPYKNLPQVQYGKPNAPAPQPPQNIKMPILSRPFGNFNFGNQNERPRGQYGIPPPTNVQQRPPPGAYLPPQTQQRPVQNQNIMNLRPPPQQPGGRFYYQQQGQSPQGQVFFPRPQATIQYGPPRPQQGGPPNQGGFNQHAGSQQSSITIPGILQLGQNAPNYSNNGDYRETNSRPQTDSQSSQTHTSNVPNHVPVEQTNDYHQSGSNIQNQHQNPSDNNVQSSPKLTFSTPKGVVKNPHIQSIEKLNPPQPSKESSQPSVIPLTRENSWEIIPALQTDITHLFNNPPPTQPVEQPREVTIPVPLPVPIPIPESHAPKSPIFIIRGQGNQNPSQIDAQQQRQNGKIVVQGVTYHEEIRNNLDQRAPPVAQTQQNFVTAPPPLPQITIPYSTQPLTERPRVTVGIPMVQQQQPQIILRPHPGHQFDPLPASISTALYHAQRTSYLTHQYLSHDGQNGEKTMYVHSVPVHQPEQEKLHSDNVQNLNPVSSSESSHVSEEGKNLQNHNNIGDQVSVNCQTHQQWVTAGNNNPDQKAEGEQSSSAAANINSDTRPGNEQKPFLLYYPTPIQQSPIYWVQPPQPSSGVVRLRPQKQSPNEDESKQSLNTVSFSPPAREWSTELVTPSDGQARKPEAQPNEQTDNGQNQGESQQDDREVDEYSFRIPYGQRLPVRTTVTPFDIISVGENSHPIDDAQAQSLEHEEDFPKSVEDYNAKTPGADSDERQEQSYQGSQEVQQSNKNDGQNNLQDFSSSGSLEQSSGAILKPVSTTVIHSPESTSYATQSFKFPSFRPQKVIFHDFTNGGGISTLLQEQQEQQQEDRAIGQPSQNVQSWRAFYRPKSPKLVENYSEDSDEGKQSIASGSSKVVHYQGNGEVASGQVTTAECGTTDPLTVTTTTLTSDNPQTFSPLSSTEVHGQNGEREKIRFRLGARFPGGRPSITSFNSWTTTPGITEPSKDDTHSLDDSDSHNPGPYSASISIPVYRPANAAREIHNHAQENSFSPPNNILNLDDIYKNSEIKQQHSLASSSSPLEEESTVATTTTTEEGLSTMSTEKSSSFSISINERMVDGNDKTENDFDANTPRKVPQNSKIEVSVSHSQDISQVPSKQSVHIVTSVPVASDYDHDPVSTTTTIATTTTTPSSANTSTKIVKTVRVRQRMRPGDGKFNGTIRNRFNGPGRIRVVQRPVTPDYIKHFPEFATQESDKLAKEEEEEVKNALIELKRSK